VRVSKTSAAIAALITACALSASAHAANLIANGGFETGDTSGWTQSDSGSGSWFVITNGGTTPVAGFSTPFLTGGGAFTATTDQGGPGSHDLSQTLTLAGGAYTLSFDARGEDQSGSGGLPEQEYVVNVDGVDISGILNDSSWSHFSFNLSLGAGAHTIDFHENDDLLFYEAGVDNVSLTGSGAVPEPATWTMMIGGFGLAGAALRRRRALAAL
jgi:hypothetical protein